MTNNPPEWVPPESEFIFWYILKYRKPVRCSDDRKAYKLIAKRRHKRVRSTYIGKYWISTVFLFLDHSMSMDGTDPVLFETMCFESGDMSGFNEEMTRAKTWREALKQHWAMVDFYKQEVKNGYK